MALQLLYVNDQMFDHFLELGEQPEIDDISHKIGVSLGVFSYEAEASIKKKKNSFDDKLKSVIGAIGRKHGVAFKRDEEMDKCSFEHEFTFERMQATKLVFMNKTISELHGLEHLAVWVAEPDLSLLSNEPYTWRGTFLYLIESIYSLGKYSSCMSGCSSLQALSNLISKKPFFHMEPGEPLGRGNYIHPIKRLENLGAVKTREKRNIVSLYKNDYLTNEICYTLDDGRKVRVNDLLGYPLFIYEDK